MAQGGDRTLWSSTASDATDYLLVPPGHDDAQTSTKTPDSCYNTTTDDGPDQGRVHVSGVQHDNDGRTTRSCTAANNQAKGGVGSNSKTQRPGGRPHQRPHYTTEKRYRANLNNSFEELRQCLVDARSFLDNDSTSERGGGSSTDYDREEQQQEATKMSKAKVLSEAVDYIRYLEAQNDRDTDYIELLESRLGLCRNVSLG